MIDSDLPRLIIMFLAVKVGINREATPGGLEENKYYLMNDLRYGLSVPLSTVD